MGETTAKSIDYHSRALHKKPEAKQFIVHCRIAVIFPFQCICDLFALRRKLASFLLPSTLLRGKNPPQNWILLMTGNLVSTIPNSTTNYLTLTTHLASACQFPYLGHRSNITCIKRILRLNLLNVYKELCDPYLEGPFERKV